MSCQFGTMDWYCVLPEGHKGSHSSESACPSADLAALKALVEVAQKAHDTQTCNATVCPYIGPAQEALERLEESAALAAEHRDTGPHEGCVCHFCMPDLKARLARLEEALNISQEDVGRIMHESWARTKRSQGFHHPAAMGHGVTAHPCPTCHPDLVPWEELPEKQKDINRHAFDAVLKEIKCRAALEGRDG